MGYIKVFRILNRILDHPLTRENKLSTLERFLRWQIGSRILRQPVIMDFVQSTKLVVEKGMTAATGNLYKGMDEFEDMSFVIHSLRPGDRFVDIGANIGSYTILASGVAGAKSISIEPSDETYSSLKRNVLLNGLSEKVECLNIAMSSKNEELFITIGRGSENRVTHDKQNEVKRVKSKSLDGILKNNNEASVLKIDVEGFEREVIEGGKSILEGKKTALVVEISNQSSRYNSKPKDTHKTILKKGFHPIKYRPMKREISETNGIGKSKNTVYVNDVEFFRKRIMEADEFRVMERKV